MRTVCVIQARMGSSRLPGKVLRQLAGVPMLTRVTNRAGRAALIDKCIIATTTNPIDDEIELLAADRGLECFRGSENDVLDRYYQVAMAHQANVIVRITSDCPLIEPEVIDRVVRLFLDKYPDIDYVTNFFPVRTFPRGLDVEVFNVDALARAWREDTNPEWREHVSDYLLRHVDQFRINNVVNESDLSHMRWTVDTPEDYQLISRIYDSFQNDTFHWTEVVALVQRNPEWLSLNSHVAQRSAF